jgi:hypothetical protein
MCAVSRFVLPAIVAGMLVGSLVNNALIAWIVAGAVGGSLYLVARRRGATLACPLPPSADVHDRTPARSSSGD